MASKHIKQRVWVSILIVAVFFYIFGASMVDLALDSSPTRGLIRDKASAAFGAPVDYQNLELSLLPLAVQVSAVSIKHDKGLQLVAQRLRGKISLWSLVMGEPKISSLDIDGLQVKFTRQERQKTSISEQEWHWPNFSDAQLESATIKDFEFSLNTGKQSLTTKSDLLQIDIDERLSMQGVLKDFNYTHGDRKLIAGMAISVDAFVGSREFQIKARDIVADDVYAADINLRGQAVVANSGKITSPVDITGNAKIDGDLRLLTTLFKIPNSNGNGQGDFQIQVALAPDVRPRLTVQGQGRVEQAVLGGIEIFDSSANLRITEKQITFERGVLQIGNNRRGNFTGVYSYADEQPFSFQGEATGLLMSELLSAFHLEFPYSDLAIDSSQIIVKGEGRPLALQVEANVEASDISIDGLHNYHDSPRCYLQLALFSDVKHLRLDKIQGHCNADKDSATQEQVRLTASGKVQYKENGAVDIAVVSEHFSLQGVQFLLPAELQGIGQMQMHIGGTTEAVVVGVKTTAQKVSFDQRQAGDLSQGEFIFYRDYADWRNVKIKTPSGGNIASDSGRMYYDDLRMQAKLAASAVKADDLRWLLSYYELPLHFGVEHLTADVSGLFFFPLAYHGNIDTTLTSIQYPDREIIIDALQMTATSNKRSWSIPNYTAKTLGMQVSGKLQHTRKVALKPEKFAQSADWWEMLGMSSNDELDIDIRLQEPARTTRMPYLEADDFIADVEQMYLKLRGKVGKLKGSGHAYLKKVQLLDLHGNDYTVDLSSVSTKLNLKIKNNDSSFIGNLDVDVRSSLFPYKWDYRFVNLDIGRMLQLPLNPTSKTQLTGSWQSQGELMNWRYSQGNLRIDAFNLTYDSGRANNQPVSIKLTKPQRITFRKNGWANTQNAMIEFSGDSSSIYLTIKPGNSFDNLRIDFFVTFDVHLLALLLDEVDVAKGFLQVEGQLHGNLYEPRVNLQMERLSPLSISVSGLQPAFNDINVKASYHNKRIMIQKLTGLKGDGSISVKGHVYTQDNQGRSHLQVELDNATFVHPIFGFNNTELNMSGNLVLYWRELPVNVGGSIIINKASNFSDFDIRKIIVASFRESKYKARSGSIEPKVAFNLSIEADKSLTIENRNIQVLLSTQLQLRGDDTNPELLGFIKIDRGKFIYRRDFIVQQGRILFDGRRRLDPILDIRAFSEVSTYTVNMNISGYASEAVGELTVNPPTYDDGSVISKVGIIRLLSRGTDARTAGGFNPGVVGLSEAMNVLVGQFEKPLENLLRFSRQDIINKIYIDTHTTGEGVLYPKFTAPVNLPWGNIGMSIQVDPYTWKLLTEYSIHSGIILSGSVSGQSSEEDNAATQEKSVDQTVDLKFHFTFE